MFKKGKRVFRFELGLVLTIFATSIAIILKELLKFDDSIITNVMYVFSIILLFDVKVLRVKKIKISKIMGVLVLFQVYIVMYAIILQEDFMGHAQAIVYTVFVLVFAFALHTNTRGLDVDFFMRLVLWISASLNIIAFYLLFNFNIGGASIRFGVLNYGTDRASLSAVPLMYIIVFFIYRFEEKRILKNKLYTNLFLYAVLAISFYNLLACNRRSVYVALICCVAFIYSKKWLGHRIVKIKRKYFLIAFIILAILLVTFSNKEIQTVFTQSVDSLIGGLITLFGMGQDLSVSMRNTARAAAFEDFYHNTLWQWLFGRGYAYAWIDFPVLQAFLDLGIFAGIIFCYYFLVLVFKAIIAKVNYNYFEMFVICYMLQTTLNCFISGTCYGHIKYCPLIVFIYFIVNKNSDRHRLQAEAVYENG